MTVPGKANFRYIARLWLPALLFGVFLIIILGAALTSGDPSRYIPAIFGIVAAAVMLISIRGIQRRKITRMLQSPDPKPMLESFRSSMRRIPNGALFGAANSATIFAFYGRFEEAEDSLNSVTWEGVPPFVHAQRSVARAAIAYAKDHVAEGMDNSIAAITEASIAAAVPGSKTSDLAFRTYRNLGLALSGGDSDTTSRELLDAFGKLPLIGKIVAAWALAVISRRNGDVKQFEMMRTFVHARAPHFRPILQSIGDA